MKVSKFITAALAASFITSASIAQAVTIEVGYPYSSLFDVTFKRMLPLFNAAHPDITVKFRATYDNYEDATNTVLRESVADKLPDVSFQGLNRQAGLVDKGIAKSLDPYIAKEANFSKEGYHQAMLDLGTFKGGV
ncbi:MAG: multiple sugar transport system substrate-binding protein, partial [Gammaproteobacteria bacterium]